MLLKYLLNEESTSDVIKIISKLTEVLVRTIYKIVKYGVPTRKTGSAKGSSPKALI